MEEQSNKEKLRQEIEGIQREIERKLEEFKGEARETARLDLEDLERKAQKIRETLREGWDNVSEKAAGALLKLIK